MNSGRTIAIAGAGSIGCFVGGMLAAGGRRVALLARSRVIGEIEANGLRPTSFEGFDQTIAANRFALSEDPSILGDAAAALVAVKSADTAAMADLIARHAPPDVVIVTLQNGVGNTAVLRDRLPGRRVLGGMVPFNVIALGNGRFHRATSGDIVIEQDEARTAEILSVPGLSMRATDNIDGVQWGKLLLNLNNALNALADLPLRRQLALRSWRMLFADQVAEGLAAIRAEGRQAGLADANSTGLDAGAVASAGLDLRCAAGTDDEDRSRGALVDVGRFAARPPHRDRLSAGRRHRDRRAARTGCAAVAPDCGVDPQGRA
jgi:2-dehydropantoate 2-reductase